MIRAGVPAPIAEMNAQAFSLTAEGDAEWTTEDVPALLGRPARIFELAGFYERSTGVQATWSNENFAELTIGSATLAIASTRTVPLFAPGAARPADNGTVIIEFLVDDVDGVHKNLAGFVEDFVNEPTTMPWGNRSLLFRDPDGDLVNFFTPVTQAAHASSLRRWSRRAGAGAGRPFR